MHARQVNTWKPRRKLQIQFSVLRRLQDSFAPGTARRFRTMSPRNEQSSDKPQTVRYITHVIANIFGPSTMVAGLLLRAQVNCMGAVWQDLRYALRGIVRSPLLSFVVLLALSAGIALNAAVFALVETSWFRPPVEKDPRAASSESFPATPAGSAPRSSFPHSP